VFWWAFVRAVSLLVVIAQTKRMCECGGSKYMWVRGLASGWMSGLAAWLLT
jgi:hypothetical protein